MNDSETSQERLTFVLFNERRDRMSPTFRSKAMHNRQIEHGNMKCCHTVVKESCFVVAKMTSRWRCGRRLLPLFHSFCVISNGKKGGNFLDSLWAATFFKKCLQFPTHMNAKIRDAGAVDDSSCFSSKTIVPYQIIEFTLTKRSVFGLTKPIAIVLK